MRKVVMTKWVILSDNTSDGNIQYASAVRFCDFTTDPELALKFITEEAAEKYKAQHDNYSAYKIASLESVVCI